MEPSSSSTSSSQTHTGQMMSSKTDSSVSKGSALSYPHSNGLSSKLLDNSGSKSISPSKKDDAGASSSSKPRDRDGAPNPPTLAPPSVPTNHPRRFIGPMLPPHMEKNRFVNF